MFDDDDTLKAPEGNGCLAATASGLRDVLAKGFGAMAALVCAIAILTSCVADTSSWYPSGKAEIASFYEYSDLGGKICVVTIVITNTGKSLINSCTVSISAATDLRTYKRTISENLVILPEKRVFLDIEIAYISETEALKPSDLVIADEFYL
ncbi:MAG: hypothetical protein WC820_10990 [Spirochaetales bacterium]|jgi:hypothetical protein